MTAPPAAARLAAALTVAMLCMTVAAGTAAAVAAAGNSVSHGSGHPKQPTRIEHFGRGGTTLADVNRGLAAMEAVDDSLDGTTLVIVGATGDLAQKYLWKAAAAAWEHSGRRLCIVGASRADPRLGIGLIQAALFGSEIPDGFWDAIHLVPLSNLEEYKALSAHITGICHPHPQDGQVQERRRVYHLAVPPFSYAGIAEMIHKGGRPDTGELRVVFEKPFGHDLHSAQELITGIAAWLRPEEILLVDHYLGKHSVQSILDFRVANADWLAPLWNAEHVQEINAVFSEALHCANRTHYYAKYGVIGDVVQNHLMEMLAVTMMEEPARLHGNPDAASAARAEFFAAFYVDLSTLAQCQYDGFIEHATDDELDIGAASSTATAMRVRIGSTSSMWAGVPINIVAGKALEVRESSVEVVFKDGTFVKFSISPTEFRIHKDLPHVVLPADWTKRVHPDTQHQELAAAVLDKPYAVMFQSALRGERSLFVSLDEAMVLWSIWSPAMSHPWTAERAYPPGTPAAVVCTPQQPISLEQEL